MRLVFLFLYFLALSCSAFAYGIFSFTLPAPVKGVVRAMRRSHGAFCAYVMSFFLWFLCAQLFDSRSVNPFFFALAHVAMYLALSVTAYFSLEVFFALGRRMKLVIALILALSSGAVSVALSAHGLFPDDTLASFFDRYDDIASLAAFCGLYGILCLILRARSRVPGGCIKAALVLSAFSVIAAFDLSFLWVSESLFFLPIAIVALNLFGAARFSRASREPSSDARIALAGVTARERVVISGLLSGDTYAQIAEKEFISVHTVKSHARNAYRKLGVATRHQLTALLAR